LYGYVLNNPVNWVDISGLIAEADPFDAIPSYNLTKGQETAIVKTLGGSSAILIGALTLPEGAPVLAGGIVVTAEGATLLFTEFALGGDTSDIPSDRELMEEIGKGIVEGLDNTCVP
jgi:hypothetical protein